MSRLTYATLRFFGKYAQNLLDYVCSGRLGSGDNTGLLRAIFTGKIENTKGARFMTEGEQRKLFPRSSQGLLIDGKNKRLSLDESYKHLLLVAQTGAGKTTKYIIPNIFELAEHKNSIIVTDPSGEIFTNTSGYMQSKGFKVLKFDPTDLEHSVYFNPLRYVFSYKENKTKVNDVKLSLLASSLVASCLPDSSDQFWKTGAEAFIEFFTACLKDAPREYHNLYNVYRLIEAMTPDGKLLEEKYMRKFVADRRLTDKWDSYLGNANATMQSHLATAKTALKPLGNEHVARILSKNTVRFKDFKESKTILYLTFPVNEAKFYTFILNLFYTQLFYEYMSELPAEEDLPLFILYDEFGNANIPEFDTIVTNIRKYKVSLSLVLQSFSQLEKQYGKAGAKTIMEGGINSMLFYAGAGLETAHSIEQMLGKVIQDESYMTSSNDERSSRHEFNLLNAGEIRTLPDNQAFFITGNKKPILLDVVPFFENRRFKGKVKYEEAYIEANNFHRFELRCALDEYE